MATFSSMDIESAISFRRSFQLFAGFEDFRLVVFSIRKDCIVSHIEGRKKERQAAGGLTGFCMRGRNKAKEGKVLRLAHSPGLTNGHAKEVKAQGFTTTAEAVVT
jgi:hypothetical protein